MIHYFIMDILTIGGVETWLYDICKLYSNDYDITLLYGRAAPEQLKRLKKMIKCIRYTGQEIECEKLIYCFDDTAVHSIKTKEINLFIHADYKAQNLRINIKPKNK